MKMNRKKLYEASQVQEQRIKDLEKMVEGLTSGFASDEYSKINPSIRNSAAYNHVLLSADRIQATNAIITDIPELNLPSLKLECLWYDYGSLCFFKEDSRVMVTSYAKTGSLNALGDLTEVQPIDFAGKTHGEHKTVVYTNEIIRNNRFITNPCVIINDYTGTYLEDVITPRRALNSVSISDQALVYRKMRNAIKITALKAIALIDNETQRESIESSLLQFFEDDSPVASITGRTINDVVKLFNIDTKLDIESYLRAIENYERMRANFNGIKTRSHLDKKERLITSEAENDNCLTDVYLYDKLLNRQIGIELMKKHSIIKEGSAKINPILKPEKEEKNNSSKKLDDKEGNNGE